MTALARVVNLSPFWARFWAQRRTSRPIEEHTLAISAVSPTSLRSCVAFAEEGSVVPATAAVMKAPIHRTNTLVLLSAEEHALALVAPLPVPLLPGCVTAENDGVAATSAGIVGPIGPLLARTKALTLVAVEEHPTALMTPPPTFLCTLEIPAVYR